MRELSTKARINLRLREESAAQKKQKHVCGAELLMRCIISSGLAFFVKTT